MTPSELGQLLWAAQGLTSADGLRTAPSAGALYPLEVYLVAGNVDDIPSGVYRYAPRRHALSVVVSGDHRAALAAAALGQESVGAAAAVIVLAAVPARTTGKYGKRGLRYIHMEVGHAGRARSRHRGRRRLRRLCGAERPVHAGDRRSDVPAAGGALMSRCAAPSLQRGILKRAAIPPESLKATVETLASAIGERKIFRPRALRAAAEFITQHWRDLGYDVAAHGWRG